jgi:predicted kinase
MVGLPCSGKTTLAHKLEREQSALRLTPDEWQIDLFGQDAEEWYSSKYSCGIASISK